MISIPTYSCTLKPLSNTPKSLWFSAYKSLDLLPCVQ